MPPTFELPVYLKELCDRCGKYLCLVRGVPNCVWCGTVLPGPKLLSPSWERIPPDDEYLHYPDEYDYPEDSSVYRKKYDPNGCLKMRCKFCSLPLYRFEGETRCLWCKKTFELAVPITLEDLGAH